MKDELAVSGIGYHPSDEQMSIRCRDAVLYIVSITSGMRNDEAIGIEVGAWRKELKNGITFYWVATIEHKTGKGLVEYLVPELTFEALNLLARYSAPIRKELEQEIRLLAKIRIVRIQPNTFLGSKKLERIRRNYFWDETAKEEKLRKATTLKRLAAKVLMLHLAV